jgi:hypothetical protein
MIRWGVVLSIASWLPLASAHADTFNYAQQVKQIQQSEVHSPEDLLDRIPFLAQIPRSFIVGDGFKMRLSSRELRVDHMGYRSHMRADQRNCMFGISYTTPVAGFFTYRLDLPLAHSDTLALENWGRSSLGDYVFYFSRTPVDHPTIKLLLSAKF